MAKGYVLVDIPESCSDCQLCTYDGDTNIHIGFFCDGTINNGFGFVKIPDEIVHNDLKPDWCPIKEFPEKKQWGEAFNGNVKGWNDCLREILGDENK